MEHGGVRHSRRVTTSRGDESDHRYQAIDVPVPGGRLRVGVWEPVEPRSASWSDGGPPTALCVHGITSSHLAWSLVARGLPGWRVVAPDLRGRGRSADLPGPYGLARHAQDVRTVASEVVGSLSGAVLVGHSMGGFVAVALLGAAPPSVGPAGVLLVDGGIPLPTPPGATGGEETIRATLGPTAERLRRTFTDQAAYRAFWADHPAFAGAWPPGLGEYFDYDLRADGSGGWRPATSEQAMTADGVEIAAPGGSPALRAGLTALSRRWGDAGESGAADSGAPGRGEVVLLRAPRDLLDRPGGMYPSSWAHDQVARVPGLRVRDVPDTNHYSLLFGEAGAAVVADAVRAAAPIA